jgi:hypothetical protein
MVWMRELAGWVLVGAGLAAFAVCYFVFLLPGRVVEATGLIVVGMTVFRAGTHLLKVAMAAKAAREIDRQPGTPRAAAKALAMPTARVGAVTPSVVPGKPAAPQPKQEGPRVGARLGPVK